MGVDRIPLGFHQPLELYTFYTFEVQILISFTYVGRRSLNLLLLVMVGTFH